ncbi:MAG: excisionase family DNA-binding protein [Dehalococcoidia bacterium]
MNDLLSIHEAAVLGNVHKTTIRRCISSGQLRLYRVGRWIRVREADIQASFAGDVAPTGHPRPRRFTGRLRVDDAILELIGLVDDPASSWVSDDKHRAVAEALSPAR